MPDGDRSKRIQRKLIKKITGYPHTQARVKSPSLLLSIKITN